MIHPLRRFRLSRKPPLTLDRLAEQVDSTKATLARIELGTRTPSLRLAARLSEVTGLPIEKFVRSNSEPVI